MGDLFLHLPFARRLRFAEGLHPIAAEAMVRRAPALVLGAALPFLPEIERKRANWFRRLFMGGAQEAAKWRKQLENREGPPRSEFVIALLSGEEGGANAPGPMTRLAFGIGVVSTEVLSVSIQPVLEGLEGSQREAVTGALARLWLQKTMPNLGGLPAEWRPAQRLQESENLKPLLVHLEAAMKTAFGDSPGRDGLHRWVKSLSTEMAPLIQSGGLPPETSIPLHEVESKYFNGDDKFLVRAQEALTRTVYLANRVAECFLGQDATKAQLSDALTEQAGALRDVPSNDVLDGVATKWKSRVADVREDALYRGRNPEAAFKEGEDGLLDGLPDLPPLPQDAGAPNVTQEVSLSQIEAEVGKAGGASADDAVAQPTADPSAAQKPPTAPANTQQVSVADIEAEVEANQSDDAASPAPPTSTQQISTADIEEEVDNASTEAAQTPAADAPTTTQQISAVDIQAEMDAADSDAQGQAQTPAPPTTTQQISAVDIQTEMDAAGGQAATDQRADEQPAQKDAFSAPAHTQQVSLSDIEAEVKASSPPPAPATSSEGEPEPPPLPETALPPGQASEATSAGPQAAAGLAPPDGVSDDANEEQSADSPDSAADSAASDGAASDGAASDGAASDSAAPDSAAPDSAAPDSAAPDSAAPDSAAPDSAAPDSAAADTADSAAADTADSAAADTADSAAADTADSAAADTADSAAADTADSAAADSAAADSAASDGTASDSSIESGAEAQEAKAADPAVDAPQEKKASDEKAEQGAEDDSEENAPENGTEEVAQGAEAKAESSEGEGEKPTPEIRPLPGPSGTPS